MDIIIISQLSVNWQIVPCFLLVAMAYNVNNKLPRLLVNKRIAMQVSPVSDPFKNGSETLLGLESPTWKCYVITFPALRSNVAKNVLLDND